MGGSACQPQDRTLTEPSLNNRHHRLQQKKMENRLLPKHTKKGLRKYGLHGLTHFDVVNQENNAGQVGHMGRVAEPKEGHPDLFQALDLTDILTRRPKSMQTCIEGSSNPKFSKVQPVLESHGGGNLSPFIFAGVRKVLRPQFITTSSPLQFIDLVKMVYEARLEGKTAELRRRKIGIGYFAKIEDLYYPCPPPDATVLVEDEYERAVNYFKLNSSSPLQINPVWRITVKILVKLRYHYSDEMPEEFVFGKLKYKAQKNWWNALFSTLYVLAEEEILDKPLTANINKFMSEHSFGMDRHPTARDVKKANELIDKILSDNVIEYIRNHTNSSSPINIDETKEIIEALRSLKMDYLDEIPDEEVHGDILKKTHGRGIVYKVQRNWWYLLIDTLQYAEEITEDESLKEKINEFVFEYALKKPIKLITTKEDIDKANQMIDDALLNLIQYLRPPSYKQNMINKIDNILFDIDTLHPQALKERLNDVLGDILLLAEEPLSREIQDVWIDIERFIVMANRKGWVSNEDRKNVIASRLKRMKSLLETNTASSPVTQKNFEIDLGDRVRLRLSKIREVLDEEDAVDLYEWIWNQVILIKIHIWNIPDEFVKTRHKYSKIFTLLQNLSEDLRCKMPPEDIRFWVERIEEKIK